MQDDQPVKPANILNIVATNQGKRPLTKQIPHAAALTVAQIKEKIAADHIIIDSRSAAEFGAGHIPGAINVQLASDEFEQRVGWTIPANTPIILVTSRDEEAQTAIYKMAFIALDRQVAGYLAGGLAAWMQAGESVVTVPQINVHALQHRLSINGLKVLDVRDDEEWSEGHIPQAHFMPYRHLVPQLDRPAEIDQLSLQTADSIAVTCATGKRSSTAVSILQRAGFKNLYNVTGGMVAWKAAGFQLVDAAGNICKT